jgi:hypothetical protein
VMLQQLLWPLPQIIPGDGIRLQLNDKQHNLLQEWGKIHGPPHPGAPYSPKQSQILKIENAGKVR